VASVGLSKRLALLTVLALFAGSASSPAFAQCSFDDRCATAVCKPDGTCNVTPLPNGTPCDDFNDCTTIDQCAAGMCTGIGFAPENTTCNDGNPCTTNDKCNPAGQCAGTALAVDSPCSYPGLGCSGTCVSFFGSPIFCQLCPGSNPCAPGLCNFSTGQCEPFNPCDEGCQTSTCEVVQTAPGFPDTFDCPDLTNKPDNTACEDFNDCTVNDRCQSGECVGTGFSGPPLTPTAVRTQSPGSGTPTPTPTATLPQPTATRTATQPLPTATRTVTVPPPTATRTATLPPTPTATTALPSPTTTGSVATATPTTGAQPTETPTLGVTQTPGTGCIGDCDHNSKVSATELVRGIDIVLGKAPLSSCMAFPDRTTLTVVDVGQAVAAALGDCRETSAVR